MSTHILLYDKEKNATVKSFIARAMFFSPGKVLTVTSASPCPGACTDFATMPSSATASKGGKEHFAPFVSHSLWRQDIQHNDSQYNDIEHNDTPHNDIQHNNKSIGTLSIMTLMVLNIDCCSAECRLC